MEVNEFTLLVESQSAERGLRRDAPEELESGFAAELSEIHLIKD